MRLDRTCFEEFLYGQIDAFQNSNREYYGVIRDRQPKKEIYVEYQVPSPCVQEIRREGVLVSIYVDSGQSDKIRATLKEKTLKLRLPAREFIQLKLLDYPSKKKEIVEEEYFNNGPSLPCGRFGGRYKKKFDEERISPTLTSVATESIMSIGDLPDDFDLDDRPESLACTEQDWEKESGKLSSIVSFKSDIIDHKEDESSSDSADDCDWFGSSLHLLELCLPLKAHPIRDVLTLMDEFESFRLKKTVQLKSFKIISPDCRWFVRNGRGHFKCSPFFLDRLRACKKLHGSDKVVWADVFGYFVYMVKGEHIDPVYLCYFSMDPLFLISVIPNHMKIGNDIYMCVCDKINNIVAS